MSNFKSYVDLYPIVFTACFERELEVLLSSDDDPDLNILKTSKAYWPARRLLLHDPNLDLNLQVYIINSMKLLENSIKKARIERNKFLMCLASTLNGHWRVCREYRDVSLGDEIYIVDKLIKGSPFPEKKRGLLKSATFSRVKYLFENTDRGVERLTSYKFLLISEKYKKENALDYTTLSQPQRIGGNIFAESLMKTLERIFRYELGEPLYPVITTFLLLFENNDYYTNEVVKSYLKKRTK